MAFSPLSYLLAFCLSLSARGAPQPQVPRDPHLPAWFYHHHDRIDLTLPPSQSTTSEATYNFLSAARRLQTGPSGPHCAPMECSGHEDETACNDAGGTCTWNDGSSTSGGTTGGSGPPSGGTTGGSGPPSGGGTSGGGGGGCGSYDCGMGTLSVTSTECDASITTCPITGEGNSHVRHLTYTAATGKFSGTFVSNFCPNHASEGQARSPDCKEQTIPDTSIANIETGPAKTPLLGRIAMSLSGGVNVYGPFEAGFTAQQAICSTTASDNDQGYGTCPAGMDVASCDHKLQEDCNKDSNGEFTDFKAGMLGDECGGHATPYHYHFDLACDYTKVPQEHSPIVAVAMDGHGVYGIYEGSGDAPSDLDACNGHTGPVPASTTYGTTASTVYHYHLTNTAPFTLGCFSGAGVAVTQTECEALYGGCSAAPTTIGGGIGDYKLWCPCYDTEIVHKQDGSVPNPGDSTGAGGDTDTSSTDTSAGGDTDTSGTDTSTDSTGDAAEAEQDPASAASRPCSWLLLPLLLPSLWGVMAH